MDIQQLLFDLCAANGVSGCESELFDLIQSSLVSYAEVTADANGNVYAVLGNPSGDKTILLDAHLDRIGLIVTDIDQNGFVKVDKCGGMDSRVLQNARLAAQDGITGTVCCLPPHLSDGSEDKATPINKVWVDFGMNAEQVREHIKIGDTLTFVSKPRMLLNNIITSPALDNRCSVAALIRCAEMLHGSEVRYKVVLLFSAQEETYGTGAATGAYRVNADEAIVVDVSFASQPDVSGQYGKIKLDGGPMIGIAPGLDKGMTNSLTALCKDKGIPYQLEPMGGRTGTNADRIAITRSGVKTAMVSIPQRYMHTAVETVAIDDIERTAGLLAAYIKNGGVQDA